MSRDLAAPHTADAASPGGITSHLIYSSANPALPISSEPSPTTRAQSPPPHPQPTKLGAERFSHSRSRSSTFLPRVRVNTLLPPLAPDALPPASTPPLLRTTHRSVL